MIKVWHRVILAVLSFVFAPGMVYLVASYGYWDLNPQHWPIGERSFIAFISFVIAVVSSVISLVATPPKD